jgi:hypothetical protein
MANMKKIVVAVTLIYLVESMMPEVAAGGQSNVPAERGQMYVMIVGGIIKEPAEQRAKDAVISNLHSYFLKSCKVKPDHMSVFGDKSSSIHSDSRTSTAKNLKRAMEGLSGHIRDTDRFVFYYVGQANVVAKKLRLNLPGQDITHEQLAHWLKAITASSILIVLDCPAAGLAIKDLAAKGRTIIAGCTDQQHYSTRFGEYFVPALTDSSSDTDGDSRVSLLEAFTLVSKQLDEWYRQRHLLRTETPLLEDNTDGIPSPQPWKYRQSGEDGLIASQFFLSPEKLKEVTDEPEE